MSKSNGYHPNQWRAGLGYHRIGTAEPDPQPEPAPFPAPPITPAPAAPPEPVMSGALPGGNLPYTYYNHPLYPNSTVAQANTAHYDHGWIYPGAGAYAFGYGDRNSYSFGYGYGYGYSPWPCACPICRPPSAPPEPPTETETPPEQGFATRLPAAYAIVHVVYEDDSSPTQVQSAGFAYDLLFGRGTMVFNFAIAEVDSNWTLRRFVDVVTSGDAAARAQQRGGGADARRIAVTEIVEQGDGDWTRRGSIAYSNAAKMGHHLDELGWTSDRGSAARENVWCILHEVGRPPCGRD